MAQHWFVQNEDETVGPISAKRLQEMAAAGGIGPETKVSLDRTTWKVAKKIKGLSFGSGLPPQFSDQESTGAARTSRLVKDRGHRKGLLVVLIGVAAVSSLGMLVAFRSGSEPATAKDANSVSIKQPTVQSPAHPPRPAEEASAVTVIAPPTPVSQPIPAPALPARKVEPQFPPMLQAADDSPAVAGDDAQHKPAVQKVDVVDLAARMAVDEFDQISGDAVSQFLRFGNSKNAQVALAGDEFDRVEAEQKAEQHRAELENKVYCVRPLRLSGINKNELERKGLVVFCNAPFRLDSRGSVEYTQYSGSVTEIHLDSSVNLQSGYGPAAMWFLTKDKTLKPCGTYEVARQIVDDGGVLYRGESHTTALLFIIRNLDVAKQVARFPGDYSVEIVVENLRWERPSSWGFYQESVLKEHLGDCEFLIRFNRTGFANVEIPYFFNPDVAFEKRPKLALASLVTASLLDGAGKIIGAYDGASPGRQLILPPNKPGAGPVNDHGAATDLGSGPLAGIWQTPAGIMYRITDDGTTVSVRLISDDSALTSLEGSLKRNGSKWKGNDVLTGSLNALYKNDPLNRGGKNEPRQLAVKRAFLTEEGTLRLMTESLFWNEVGKVIRRQPETVELTKEK